MQPYTIPPIRTVHSSNMLSLKLAVCVCVIFTLGIEADQIPPWWTPPTHRAAHPPWWIPPRQRAVVTQHPLWWIPTRYEYNRGTKGRRH